MAMANDAITEDARNHEELEFHETRHLLFYAVDVSLLG
jgi:hypothetical protein